MDEKTSKSGKTAAKQTIAAGGSGTLSGYMVASGDSAGAMACQVGDTVFEGNYSGSEGDPCEVNISVQ